MLCRYFHIVHLCGGSSSAKYLKREPHFEWTPKDPGESGHRHRLPRAQQKTKQGTTISRPKKKSGTDPRVSLFRKDSLIQPTFFQTNISIFWVIYLYCHTSIPSDPTVEKPGQNAPQHLRFFHLERSRQRWPCWYSRRRRVQCPSTPSKARQKISFIWVNHISCIIHLGKSEGDPQMTKLGDTLLKM